MAKPDMARPLVRLPDDQFICADDLLRWTPRQLAGVVAGSLFLVAAFTLILFALAMVPA